MQYRIIDPKLTHCMECGSEIEYGRSDKKFCCVDCKNRYYNRQTRTDRAVKRRIYSSITHNYKVLSMLLKKGVRTISIVDAITLGFRPGVVTSHCRKRRHDEYTCLDIKFIITNSKLIGIEKIENLSLSLQPDYNNLEEPIWETN